MCYEYKYTVLSITYGPDRETLPPGRCNLVIIVFSRISSVLYVLNRVLS